MKAFFKEPGVQIVLIYLAITYLFQSLFFDVFNDELDSLYNGADSSLILPFLVSIWFVIILYILYSFLPTLRQFTISRALNNFLFIVSSLLIVLFLISAINFFLTESISFRHTTRARDAGLLTKIFVFLSFYVRFFAFLMFVEYLRKRQLRGRDKLLLMLVLVGVTLSINGSSTVIFIFILFMLLFFPRVFVEKLNLIKLSILFPVIALIGIIVVFFGFANKVGFDNVVLYFQNDLYGSVLSPLVVRISTSYMSLQNMVYNHALDLELQFLVLQHTFVAFIERVNMIIPFVEVLGYEIYSINRINFLLLFKPFNDHAGTSPGLLATIFYLPFLSGVLLIPFYVLIVVRAIRRYLDGVSITLFSTLVLMFLILPLLESPLTLLKVIEPVSIFFVLFVVSSFVRRDPQAVK
jgi:hypothetical protein